MRHPRIILLALLALFAGPLLALAACAAAPIAPPAEPMTIAAYHAEDGSFSALDQDISDGTSLPCELYVHVDRRCDDVIVDQGEIVSCWNALRSVEVLAGEPDPAISIDDGDISFEFHWPDGGSFCFSFLTSEYHVVDGGCIRVGNPDAVRAIVDDAVTHLEALGSGVPEPDDGFLIELDGGFFSWDGDGDGVEETYEVDFHDLGDEAPSFIEIVQVEDPALTTFLDRAYGIELIQALEDEHGPYLRIDYLQGDFYAHDDVATCYLRIVDGTIALGD
ncbi:MAG: hypothetical protein Q4D39_02105 [Coriobacteriaceae bacterium]|nr:hypothetical protein [Coriobacteriaceae bacterium]